MLPVKPVRVPVVTLFKSPLVGAASAAISKVPAPVIALAMASVTFAPTLLLSWSAALADTDTAAAPKAVFDDCAMSLPLLTVVPPM